MICAADALTLRSWLVARCQCHRPYRLSTTPRADLSTSGGAAATFTVSAYQRRLGTEPVTVKTQHERTTPRLKQQTSHTLLTVKTRVRAAADCAHDASRCAHHTQPPYRSIHSSHAHSSSVSAPDHKPSTPSLPFAPLPLPAAITIVRLLHPTIHSSTPRFQLYPPSAGPPCAPSLPSCCVCSCSSCAAS